ncbi:MAG: SRPBCC domain-containing protein [Bacteroidota bacterium]
MDENEKIWITVESVIEAKLDLVWKCWTTPADIVNWNQASDDWHTTRAEVDLQKGGKFLSRMEAKDGSFGFDFEGVYVEVKQPEFISCLLGDGRKMTVTFFGKGERTQVIESFQAESTNPVELQKFGWQAILDNFKKYTEQNRF